MLKLILVPVHIVLCVKMDGNVCLHVIIINITHYHHWSTHKMTTFSLSLHPLFTTNDLFVNFRPILKSPKAWQQQQHDKVENKFIPSSKDFIYHRMDRNVWIFQKKKVHLSQLQDNMLLHCETFRDAKLNFSQLQYSRKASKKLYHKFAIHVSILDYIRRREIGNKSCHVFCASCEARDDW